MLATLLMLAAQNAEALLVTARERTTAETRCVVDPQSTDITVCGLRGADRFRVPFIVHDAGDPRYESVAAERDRLLHRTSPLEELSLFQVGGGFAGVTASSSAGGVALSGPRKLAP